jgi:hypothetical protein
MINGAISITPAALLFGRKSHLFLKESFSSRFSLPTAHQ